MPSTTIKLGSMHSGHYSWQRTKDGWFDSCASWKLNVVIRKAMHRNERCERFHIGMPFINMRHFSNLPSCCTLIFINKHFWWLSYHVPAILIDFFGVLIRKSYRKVCRYGDLSVKCEKWVKCKNMKIITFINRRMGSQVICLHQNIQVSIFIARRNWTILRR